MNYYPRHIGDYLTATAHLSLLEHGVYTRLLDVYYTREAPIPDDQAERLIGARTPDERAAVRAVLAEFFVLGDDGWRQSRCDEEIAACREKQAKAAKSADARWSKQRAERSECERNANAMRTQCEGNAPNTNTNIPTSRRSVGRARATRLPPDWEPPDLDWGNACIALGIPQAQAELAKFRDYWAAKAGAGGVKADWAATWRNWVRKAGEYAESRRTGEKRLSVVEQTRRDSAEWARRRAGNGVLVEDGEPVWPQVAQPVRLVAGRVVGDGPEDVGF